MEDKPIKNVELFNKITIQTESIIELWTGLYNNKFITKMELGKKIYETMNVYYQDILQTY